MQDETGLQVEKETTLSVLSAYAEAYRQEVNAEEDVYRTLPFFGTALGIIIAAIGYAAGRLTRWEDTPSHWLFIVSTGFLAAAAVEAIGVVARLSQALARRDYQRVGPEPVLQARLAELRTYYDGFPPGELDRDGLLAHDFRQGLVESYGRVIPINRQLNAGRYHRRAQAASHLVRSLLWALGATIVIFVSDKTGLLPKVVP